MKTPNKILWINEEIMTVYHSTGVIICKDADEFNKMVLQETQKISSREYALDRYEPWEVDSVKDLQRVLVKRAKNNEERNLVQKYIEHLKEN